jgi:hypothetical protein
VRSPYLEFGNMPADEGVRGEEVLQINPMSALVSASVDQLRGSS